MILTLTLTLDDDNLKFFYVSLYEKYGPTLRRRCERILGNQADAEDTVHGLFTDLIQKKKRRIDFSYLYRAATNRCISFVTLNKRRMQLLEREINSSFEYRYQLDDKVVDLQMLSLLIKQLNKKASEILVYRFVDNMTQTEIAVMMGVTRRTVNNYLKRIETAAAKLKNKHHSPLSFTSKGDML